MRRKVGPVETTLKRTRRAAALRACAIVMQSYPKMYAGDVSRLIRVLSFVNSDANAWVPWPEVIPEREALGRVVRAKDRARFDRAVQRASEGYP